MLRSNKSYKRCLDTETLRQWSKNQALLRKCLQKMAAAATKRRKNYFYFSAFVIFAAVCVESAPNVSYWPSVDAGNSLLKYYQPIPKILLEIR